MAAWNRSPGAEDGPGSVRSRGTHGDWGQSIRVRDFDPQEASVGLRATLLGHEVPECSPPSGLPGPRGQLRAPAGKAPLARARDHRRPPATQRSPRAQARGTKRLSIRDGDLGGHHGAQGRSRRRCWTTTSARWRPRASSGSSGTLLCAPISRCPRSIAHGPRRAALMGESPNLPPE